MAAEHTAPPEGGFSQYQPLVPRRPVEVRQLYSVHYFEYTGAYAYPGERHDFWELLYVDKGAVLVTAGERRFRLEQGQAVFHAPGEFHAFSAAGVAPDLVVVSFRCGGPAVEFFRGQTASVGSAERALLGRIVAESSAAFSTPLNLSSATCLERRENQPFGAEQLVCAALEELLIRLIRQGGQPIPACGSPAGDGGTLAQVMDYLEQRVDRSLTLEQICRDNLVGRSQLQKLFHTHTGSGVMAWFAALKIQAARRLIREGRLNFTQIAARLGYQSVHYFSRRFRAATGMSPSEYAHSVKMLSEHQDAAPDDCANNVYDRIFPFRPSPLKMEAEPNHPGYRTKGALSMSTFAAGAAGTNKPVLVIMAAGMGSRYGGMKQLDPVGGHGQLIIDYSIYDAHRAGFDTVIFVIKEENEADFRACVGDRVSKVMDVRYAFQRGDDLPQGYALPPERTKPWGTAQAALAARHEVNGPFAIINADDYYGPEAFRLIYDHLCAHPDGALYQYAMVGYLLRNTVTEHGSVSRGVCTVGETGILHSIVEHTTIEKAGDDARFTEDGGRSWNPLPGDTVVSMNMWGFTRSFLDEALAGFPAFLDKALAENPAKAEYFLPSVVERLIAQDKAQVRVLLSEDKWYGVTYREDKPAVVAAIAEKTRAGLYPDQLWED